jgi:hypothetical protein
MSKRVIRGIVFGQLPDEQALGEAADGVGDCLATLRALVQGIGSVSS